MPDNQTGGWRRIRDSNGIQSLGLAVSGSNDAPSSGPSTDTFVFGMGDEAGRVSTGTRSGAALTIPDTYGFGEMIELRFTFAETGNSQRQGIFMDVRTNVANSSTVRGFEIMAQQEGAVAVGTLSGGSMKAITRSATTGAITNMYGGESETTHNSDAYTGTITELAGFRTKVTLEDGATYTNSSGFLANVSALSSGDVIGSYYRATSDASITATAAIDVSGAGLVETNSGKDVWLIKFTGANGTGYALAHDTDSATAVKVVTT